MKRVIACAFACLMVAGCVAELTAAGAIITAIGGAITTAARTVPVIIEAREAIKSKEGLRAKLKEFRVRYCAEEALRAQAGEDLVRMLSEAGVDAEAAFAHVAEIRKWSGRLCGG